MGASTARSQASSATAKLTHGDIDLGKIGDLLNCDLPAFLKKH
jgi:hypothetical protein